MLAITASLLTAIFPIGTSNIEIVVLAALIFFLGVPHGALDVIFAERLYRLVSFAQWATFCACYVLLASTVVGLWWAWPSLFLPVFFLLSAFHFSGDLDDGTSASLRFWYSGSMLIFPAWFHEVDVARLFTYLVDKDVAWPMANFLHSLAIPWLVGLSTTLVALVLQTRVNRFTALEVISVGFLAIATPPLVSFTLFFCVMHSMRHAIRTRGYSEGLCWSDLVKKALAPMTLCAVLAGVIWPFLHPVTLDMALVQLLFVGLAALTVPHMVLIERVRYSNWKMPTRQ